MFLFQVQDLLSLLTCIRSVWSCRNEESTSQYVTIASHQQMRPAAGGKNLQGRRLVMAPSTALPPAFNSQIEKRLHQVYGALTSAGRWSMSVSSQVGQFSLSHAVGDTACKLPASLTWTGYDCATSCRCSTNYPHRKPDESLAASLRPDLEVGKVPEYRPVIHCVATTRQRCLLRRH